MKIRKANKFDVSYFIDTVLKLQQAGHNQFVSQVPLDHKYLTELFNNIIYGQGVALIASDDGKVAGLCVGVIAPNIWDPKTNFMHQIIIYTEEEYRYTRAGYELINEYTEAGKKFIENGRILNYTFGVSEPMFNLKLERFGYELKEKTWIGAL